MAGRGVRGGGLPGCPSFALPAGTGFGEAIEAADYNSGAKSGARWSRPRGQAAGGSESGHADCIHTVCQRRSGRRWHQLRQPGQRPFHRHSGSVFVGAAIAVGTDFPPAVGRQDSKDAGARLLSSHGKGAEAPSLQESKQAAPALGCGLLLISARRRESPGSQAHGPGVLVLLLLSRSFSQLIFVPHMVQNEDKPKTGKLMGHPRWCAARTLGVRTGLPKE